MKKFILSAMAVTMVAMPVLAAAPAEAQGRTTTIVRHDNGRTVVTKTVPTPVAYRSWHKGQRFDHRYARDYRVVDNYRTYHLNAPPRGYHWVRSGNDAVLVGVTTGLIASVLANRIH